MKKEKIYEVSLRASGTNAPLTFVFVLNTISYISYEEKSDLKPNGETTIRLVTNEILHFKGIGNEKIYTELKALLEK